MRRLNIIQNYIWLLFKLVNIVLEFSVEIYHNVEHVLSLTTFMDDYTN